MSSWEELLRIVRNCDIINTSYAWPYWVHLIPFPSGHLTLRENLEPKEPKTCSTAWCCSAARLRSFRASASNSSCVSASCSDIRSMWPLGVCFSRSCPSHTRAIIQSGLTPQSYSSAEHTREEFQWETKIENSQHRNFYCFTDMSVREQKALRPDEAPASRTTQQHKYNIVQTENKQCKTVKQKDSCGASGDTWYSKPSLNWSGLGRNSISY